MAGRLVVMNLFLTPTSNQLMLHLVLSLASSCFSSLSLLQRVWIVCGCWESVFSCVWQLVCLLCLVCVRVCVCAGAHVCVRVGARVCMCVCVHTYGDMHDGIIVRCLVDTHHTCLYRDVHACWGISLSLVALASMGSTPGANIFFFQRKHCFISLWQQHFNSGLII